MTTPTQEQREVFIRETAEIVAPEELARLLDGAYSAINSLINGYFKLAELLIEDLGEDEADDLLSTEVDPLINSDARQAITVRVAHDMGIPPEDLYGGLL